jgi:hypothetical protein
VAWYVIQPYYQWTIVLNPRCQVNLSQLLPADIGVAAAYEAYRYWKHHNRILFEPLGGEIEREKEGLVGLAIAEGICFYAFTLVRCKY